MPNPSLYAPYIHYSLSFFIIIFSIITLKKISISELLFALTISSLGLISVVLGYFNDYSINFRGVIIPIIFFIVLNSNSHKILKTLFLFIFLITILEYILYYTDIFKWNHIGRLGMLRPHGGLLDSHSNSLFLAVSIYVFGHPILGAFVAISSLSFQTPVAYSILLIRKNFYFFLILISISIILLSVVGHFNLKQKTSMVAAYNSIPDYKYNICHLLGCSSNKINLISEEKVNKISDEYILDIGFIRATHFFGIPWILLYLIFLLRLSKSKLIPIVYFITLIHFPIVFGIINTCLLAILINYNNQKFKKNF